MQAFFQNTNIEVDEEPDWNLRKLQIRDHLGVMDWQDSLDCFELQQDAILDDDVQAVTAVDEQILVSDGQRDLPVEPQTTETRLFANTGLVGRLE